MKSVLLNSTLCGDYRNKIILSKLLLSSEAPGGSSSKAPSKNATAETHPQKFFYLLDGLTAFSNSITINLKKSQCLRRGIFWPLLFVIHSKNETESAGSVLPFMMTGPGTPGTSLLCP